jgi:hypothetical protein
MTSETLYSYRDAKSITQTLQCRQQDFVSFKGGWHWFSLMGTFLPFEIITYAI